MTKLQRVKGVAVGLIMLILGTSMALIGADAAFLIMGLLALTLNIKGIKMLIYYFNMARHMVGGDQILVRGLILFDLGTFTATLTQFPQLYIMGYLLTVHAFSGIIDVMRALEAKHFDSPSWKLNLSTGVINIIIGLSCVVFINSMSTAVYIYSAGIIYSAIIRIVTSFRKTAVVYITPS